MERHVFVDESKADDYLLIASVLAPRDLPAALKGVRSLVLPGQQRLHMKTESDGRRKLILATFAQLGFTATIYRADASHGRELARREACLKRLVADLASPDDTFLCLESDETLDARDRKQLFGFTRAVGFTALHYEHRRATQQPLLAVPDAIGWAWAKGKDWRRRTSDLVVDVIDV